MHQRREVGRRGSDISDTHVVREARPYLTGREMAFLQTLLDECTAELEVLGLLNRSDRDYEPIRLRMAAALLCHAGWGEEDRAELKDRAFQSLEPTEPRRLTI